MQNSNFTYLEIKKLTSQFIEDYNTHIDEINHQLETVQGTKKALKISSYYKANITTLALCEPSLIDTYNLLKKAWLKINSMQTI